MDALSSPYLVARWSFLSALRSRRPEWLVRAERLALRSPQNPEEELISKEAEQLGQRSRGKDVIEILGKAINKAKDVWKKPEGQKTSCP